MAGTVRAPARRATLPGSLDPRPRGWPYGGRREEPGARPCPSPGPSRRLPEVAGIGVDPAPQGFEIDRDGLGYCEPTFDGRALLLQLVYDAGHRLHAPSPHREPGGVLDLKAQVDEPLPVCGRRGAAPLESFVYASSRPLGSLGESPGIPITISK